MTTSLTQSSAEQTSPLWKQLVPLCVMVFTEFLAMGLPLPVLPGRVHDTLGFGAFVVGLVIGAQSWVTLLTRHAAGVRTDQRGPRNTVLLGLSTSTLAGVLYGLSSAALPAKASLVLLLAGRGVLGFGESLVITGALAWGVTLAGPKRAGVVMAWVGIAMYGALALGAPLGTALVERVGFLGLSVAVTLAPMPGLAAAFFTRPVSPAGGTRVPFFQVIALVGLPGAGLSLCAVGFGAIAAFATLTFRDHGWAHASLALSAFGAAYVLARLFFAGLPDRFGGARIAAVSAAVATAGQLGLFLATSSSQAVASAALTGLGFSLAFPAFGVEAIRRVPPQTRGVALGAYTACFDATMGLGVPALGAVVSSWGTPAAFAVGALTGLGSLAIALLLVVRSAAGALSSPRS